ncbi:MAG: hypothetical protein RLZ62_1976, partial [Bacteroidota bacterium]
FEKTGNRGGTIEQRKLRMAVKMGEIRHIERDICVVDPKVTLFFLMY